MIRRSLVVLAWLAVGCKEEPTIVITFAPQDLAVARTPDLGRPPDLGAAPDLAPATVADPCKSDADCVLVREGCCECSAGGTMIAVARTAAKKHSAMNLVKCAQAGQVLCAQMMSEHPSCQAKAACLGGRCGYRQKAPPKK